MTETATRSEAGSWDALRQLRMTGQKPSLPIIVTTKRKLVRNLEGAGCMTILHEAGTPMPVQLLDGLDVIFYFDKCELASQVLRLAESKNVKLGWCRTYCTCGSFITIAPMYCESYEAAMDWLDNGGVW